MKQQPIAIPNITKIGYSILCLWANFN